MTARSSNLISGLLPERIQERLSLLASIADALDIDGVETARFVFPPDTQQLS
jgi:hypothetical protein